MDKVKVLVVDDSAFMRKLIKDMLSDDHRIDVIGTARDGRDALSKIKMLHPDVVTLDVEMPIMNGIEALKRIMKETPLPVIMVSSTTTEGAKNTLLAMAYGAFDFIPKPGGQISPDIYKIKDELIHKVLEAKQANMDQLSGLSQKESPVRLKPAKKREKTGEIPQEKKSIVLIGTSTGGPRALEKLLTSLPRDLKAPVLIVQHMPANFTKLLAERLDTLSSIRVKEAEQGEILQNGVAYIAPGGKHLLLKQIGNTIKTELSTSPPEKGHRPSVDLLFTSASRIKGYKKIAVVLTGMGSDGTEGLISLKRSNNLYAIAESEKTSIIYGMPKSAVKTGYVDIVLDIDQIADQIIKKVNEDDN